MKRALLAFGAVLSLAVLVAVTVPPRPGSEYAAFQMLNGQPTRWVLPDGGRSGLFGSGQQCADLTGSGAQVVMLIAEGPINLCVQPSTYAPLWDGGCNSIDSDQNFGVPLQAWVPQYLLLDPNAAYICAVSDAGTERVPLFKMY